MKVEVIREDPPPPPPPPPLKSIRLELTPDELRMLFAALGASNGVNVKMAIIDDYSEERHPVIAKMSDSAARELHYRLYSGIQSAFGGMLKTGEVIK